MEGRPKCNLEVFFKGRVIFWDSSVSLSPSTMEDLIKALRPYLREGVQLDWHYASGRNVLKALDAFDPRPPLTEMLGVGDVHLSDDVAEDLKKL